MLLTQPLRNSDICCIYVAADPAELLLTLHLHYNSLSICCLLQLQHQQLKNILNTKSTVISMMHLSPKSLTDASICAFTEASALLLTLRYCQFCTVLPNIWHLTAYTATNPSCY